MTRWIHFKDPRSPEISRLLETIPDCPGVCIFIDIVDSTVIKYHEPFTRWGQKLNNTFNFISLLNDFPENIVKGIGDEIMLYIPDEELKKKSTYNSYYELLEEIYATLDNLKDFPDKELFLPCKVAIHYCTHVHNITFLEGFNDYYGKDIDLTARLKSKTKSNRIVLSEKYYKMVLNDLKARNLSPDHGCMQHVSEKYIEDFKGVPAPTEFRMINL
jgi:class 3 adenylate cyclase